MNLAAFVLSALLALHHGPVSDADQDRYRALADVIVEESVQAPLWPGEVGQLSTALALVAIAHHESGVLERVQRCRVKGDTGRSIGLFQLMKGASWQGHTADEICADDHLQARLALAVLHRAADQCPRCAPAFWFRAYASGNGGRDSAAARATISTWERTSRKVGVSVSAQGQTPPKLIAALAN